MKFYICLALLIYVSRASNLRAIEIREEVGGSINTSSGAVNGHAASNATSVSEYLGIPYAQPPIGELRFAPPQRYNGSSTINGTDFGFSCPAVTRFETQGPVSNWHTALANLTVGGLAFLEEQAQKGADFSEDCLTLNVWVPSGGEEKKAVLVWIYGGGFKAQSTSIPTYNGQNLAEQEDIIVVSLNYRLSIFGFPGFATDSGSDKNFGLLDQRMAIEWVRDNIAAFGGDVDRITLFGQSAGSASIDFYSYAYTSDPIVSGLILESGTIGFGGDLPVATTPDHWFTVTSALGCGDESSASTKVTSCMRKKSFSAILKAVGTSAFVPNVDNQTVFADYPARSTAGNFIKAPLLIGTSDFEGGLFAVDEVLSKNVVLPHSSWVNFTLNTFTCPAGSRANISLSAGVPTWRYRWFGSFPNTQLTTFPNSGAWHGSQNPIIFDTAVSGPGIPPATDAEVAIGTYLRGAWAAFAKDPVGGLAKYQGGWPAYNPEGETLVRLAYANLTGTNLALPGDYDSDCTDTVEVSVSAGSGATSTTSAGGGTATGAKPSATSKSSAVGNSVGIVGWTPLIFGVSAALLLR